MPEAETGRVTRRRDRNYPLRERRVSPLTQHAAFFLARRSAPGRRVLRTPVPRWAKLLPGGTYKRNSARLRNTKTRYGMWWLPGIRPLCRSTFCTSCRCRRGKDRCARLWLRSAPVLELRPGRARLDIAIAAAGGAGGVRFRELLLRGAPAESGIDSEWFRYQCGPSSPRTEARAAF